VLVGAILEADCLLAGEPTHANTRVLSTVATFERESIGRASAGVGIVVTCRILSPRADPSRRSR
jgi:hypothetical protein